MEPCRYPENPKEEVIYDPYTHAASQSSRMMILYILAALLLVASLGSWQALGPKELGEDTKVTQEHQRVRKFKRYFYTFYFLLSSVGSLLEAFAVTFLTETTNGPLVLLARLVDVLALAPMFSWATLIFESLWPSKCCHHWWIVSIFTLLSLLLFLGYATSSDLALLACLTVAVHGYMAMAWACGAWRCWRRELDGRTHYRMVITCFGALLLVTGFLFRWALEKSCGPTSHGICYADCPSGHGGLHYISSMPFLAFGYFCLMQLYDPPEWLLPPGSVAVEELHLAHSSPAEIIGGTSC